MVNIFTLYENNKIVNTFKSLGIAMKFIENYNNNCELYVEELNHDIESHMIKTLIYKNNVFQLNDVYNYY